MGKDESCQDSAEQAKASRRWIEGYERVAERAGQLPATRLVYVADREADILELMQRAHALSYPADYLLRAQHNRCLPQGGKLWPPGFDTSPRFSPLFGKSLQHRRGFQSHDRKSSVVARL